MQQFIVRRLLLALPTLVLVSFITFAAIRLMPGDPASTRLGDAYSEEAARTIRAQLGLDKPWYEQYGRWLADLSRGSLGNSSAGGGPVARSLFSRFQATAVLAAYALCFALLLGIPAGIASALWQNSISDLLIRAAAIGGLSIPGFFLATLVLAYKPFGWVPPLGGYAPPWENLSKNLQILAVPAALLGLSVGAGLMRYTRTMMLEVFRQDYIRTARSKGLTNPRVIIRHALPNGLVPVITIAGVSAISLMGGTVIYESIFGIPGVGTYLIGAASRSDYPALQGVTFVMAVLVLIINLSVDIICTILNPRRAV